MRWRQWAAVGLLAVGMTTNACGGGTTRTVVVTSTAPVAVPPAASTTTPAAPVPSVAELRSTARTGLLDLADFPTGWTQQAKAPATTTACADIRRARQGAGRAQAGRFKKEDTAQTDDTVYVYATESAAKTALELLDSTRNRRCVADALGGIEEPGATISDVELARLRVAEQGDDVRASRVTFTITAQQQEVPASVDIVFVREGRAVSTLVFTSAYSAFDDDLRDRLTDASDQQLRRALR